MGVKARVSCISVTDYGNSKEVICRPIVSSGDDDPNKSFSTYTPDGEIKLSITNPEAFNQFAPGKIYDLDFKEVEVPV